MLTHMVLIRLKPEHVEQARSIQDQLLAMQGQVPTLRSIEAGTDVIHSERSYDIGLIARFDSVEDMKAYQVHPVHQAVLKQIAQYGMGSVTVDFEA